MIFGRCGAIVALAAIGAATGGARVVPAWQRPARQTSAPAAVATPSPLAELPLAFEKELPLASIRVNGHELLVILDSAASGCVLDAQKAAEIGVKGTESAVTSGSGGTASVTLARGVRLGLGRVEIVPEFAVLTKLSGLGFVKPVHGVLGAPLFGAHVVEIDYSKRIARIFDPDRYQAPPEAETLRLWMTDGPTVRGRLSLPGGEEIGADFQLDTGSSHVLTLCKPFVDRHRLLERVPGLLDGETRGIGGKATDKIGRITRVSMGSRTMEQPEVRFSTHAGGSLDTERFGANLGNGFLSRYVATFDVPHGRLLLRRPKREATRFAPETIGGADCFCHTLAPDGRTAVFVRSQRGLYEARLHGDRWRPAKPLPFSGAADVRDGDPNFSPDGSRLYFWSSRDGKTSLNTDLYVVERRVDGWGAPRNLGPPVNNEVNEPFPAVAADGTLYFGTARPGSGGIDLYRARPSGGGYAEPENLGNAVNSEELDLDGYISPDQTTLVFASNRPGGYGKLDLYASRWMDGHWSAARNLGPEVNGAGDEFCPQLIEGGAVLLFSRGGPDAGAFQVEASVLEGPQP